ncbi:MAG: ribosome assembly cofactor RimP [Flavobacteriales bacterium]
MISEQVEKLVNSFLNEHQNIFLVEKKVSASNQIEILIDSFDHISIKDCVMLSRHIESNLNRDETDFSLQVASAGLSEPFKVFDQYKKYIGKDVDVLLKGGQRVIGKMLEANEKKGLVIETKKKEKIGKKKVEVVDTHSYPFDKIEKTKIVISF